jgi:hypothetical protein
MANPKSIPSFVVRFWSRVTKPSDGCWEWTAARFPVGYGKVALPRAKQGGHGKTEGAHRIAWILTNGPIPDGLWVLHHCDNRLCCRPDHLFLGTCRDNTQDASKKGRLVGSRGMRPPNAKFTDSEADNIRCRVAAGERRTALAREFSVDRSVIRRIVRCESYRNHA